MRIHAIHRLYDARVARSTRPFRARGFRVERCRYCMLRTHLCICSAKPELTSQAAFLLLMYDDEVLKPSNTGRLIADLFPDTFAYIWSRTSVEPDVTQLLADPQWQPFVIFPAEYAEPNRATSTITMTDGKRPLFILLDGSWSEAKKMFRKSPYLNGFPVLSIDPDAPSRYKVREASKDNQLGTAEVAAKVIDLFGEHHNAATLDLWFDLFRDNYIAGKLNRESGSENLIHALKLHQENGEDALN